MLHGNAGAIAEHALEDVATARQLLIDGRPDLALDAVEIASVRLMLLTDRSFAAIGNGTVQGYELKEVS